MGSVRRAQQPIGKGGTKGVSWLAESGLNEFGYAVSDHRLDSRQSLKMNNPRFVIARNRLAEFTEEQSPNDSRRSSVQTFAVRTEEDAFACVKTVGRNAFHRVSGRPKATRQSLSPKPLERPLHGRQKRFTCRIPLCLFVHDQRQAEEFVIFGGAAVALFASGHGDEIIRGGRWKQRQRRYVIARSRVWRAAIDTAGRRWRFVWTGIHVSNFRIAQTVKQISMRATGRWDSGNYRGFCGCCFPTA